MKCAGASSIYGSSPAPVVGALGLCIRSGTCAAAGAFLQVSGGW